MSLYAEYLVETIGKQIVESPIGFATYYFLNDGVYLEDIYVSKEHRKSGEASRLADEVAAHARASGYKKMYGTVVPTRPSATASTQILIAYGFQVHSSDSNVIWFVKQLD